MTAPPPAGAGQDRTTLFGVLGIVFSICLCWPVGLIFAILSLNHSKKFGSSPVLAYVGFVLVALSLISGIVGFTQGWYPI